MSGLIRKTDWYVRHSSLLFCTKHAELNSEFKQYLEDKGLKEVHMFKIVVPVVFGLLCKSLVHCRLA